MMRRSLVSLMGLVEAQQLLATDSSKINVSQLADVLKALPKESTVVHSALQHLSTKDQTAIDSFEVSQHTDHFRNLVDLMKASTNDMRVKEYCCRAIANGCLLPSDLLPEALRYTTLDITTSNATSSNSPTKAAQNYADILVEHGAVDGVLNAMSMSPRLRSTHKGACWTATALQNLVVLSREGAQKAAARDAEEVISNFIMELCEDSLELIQKYHTAARDYSNDVLEGLESHDGLNMTTVGDALRLRHIAVDAALASLVRILATSEKDNSNGILSRYQRAPAVAAEAAMIALSTPFSIGAATSAVIGGGVAMTSSPRSFVFELETQMRTPVLHKAWEVLRLITSHTPNLPMTFDAMQHVSDAIMRRGGGRVLAGMVPLRSHDGQSTKDGHSEAAFGSVSSVVHPFAFALSQQTTAIFGPAFTLTEKKADFQLAMVEKEKAAASAQAANEAATIKNLSESEEAAEQELLPLKAFSSALATLCDLSAPRKDVAQTTSDSTTTTTTSGGGGEDVVSHGANASIPTEAANMILNAIASGDISKTIVGQLPKRWAKVHQPLGTGSDPRSMVVRGSHAHVCCLYLTLLSNISDIDSVIPSTNCAAVIHSILEEFVAVLQRVSFDIKKVEGGGAADGVVDANANIKVFRSLYVPVAGKCLELIWNITGIPSGAAALDTLGTPALIQRIQTTAKICASMQIPPPTATADDSTTSATSTPEESSSQPPKKSEVSELMNSMQELEKLSGKLNEKIQAFITSPTFVHTKKY